MTLLAAAGLAGVVGVDGFFPQRLIQLFQRRGFLAAEENRTVTITYNGIGAVLIERLELALRLQDKTG